MGLKAVFVFDSHVRLAAAAMVFLCCMLSCGDSSFENAMPAGAIGYVVGDAPIVDASVRVFAWDRDGKLQKVARTEPTDLRGQFVIDEPLPNDPLLFVASSTKAGETLRALVTGETLRAANNRLVISPLTEIEAALGDFWQSQGSPPRDAVAIAKHTWREHLLGDEAAHAPSLFAHFHPSGSLEPTATNDAMAMLWAGFVRLSERRGRVASTERPAWAALTRALVEDVAADGRLDGRGRRGAPLASGALRLDGDTMRTDWAESVLQEAEAKAAIPGNGRSRWLSLANGLVGSPADLFLTTARDVERSSPCITVDESLLWCDDSGRALLSGTVDRSISALWLERADGQQQVLSAWPRGAAWREGEHWFASEIEGVRLAEWFQGTLVAVDVAGLKASLPIAFACGAAKEMTQASN